jgi:iron(III) transport system substrate-binding protein
MPIQRLFLCAIAAALLLGGFGCRRGQPGAEEVVVYCGVDEPYASKVFADFERETGIRVAPRYDIESSKSVGLAGRLEAEKDHPRADVWWGSEEFLTVRLAEEGVLATYVPPSASDIPAQYKDDNGMWTGVGLRARVLAVGQPPPPFKITSIQDLADPRLKDKVCISRPTAGATGAHMAALYVAWGPAKARAFFRKLHDNGIALLGGNAEVADQVGAGIYSLGLTDSDDITNAQANGGKLTMVVPDQGPESQGTLAMPTTVALVKGAANPGAAKKLIDYLVSQKAEQKLLDLKFARWSVRAGTGGENGIKAMRIDYRAAARVYPVAQRVSGALLEGRQPE